MRSHEIDIAGSVSDGCYDTLKVLFDYRESFFICWTPEIPGRKTLNFFTPALTCLPDYSNILIEDKSMNDRLKLLFRRRNKVINPGYQLKVAFTVAISLLVYSFILGVVIFYPLFTQLSSQEGNAAIAAEILALHKRLWPAVLVISILVFIQTIFASHRVAGPVYRLEKALEELARGNYKERVRLRKGDEFVEIEQLVNTLAESLGNAKAADAAARAGAVEMLKDIQRLAGSDAKESEDIKKKADEALRILGIDG
ncbi:MAG: HAMP domain-containing protein [Thermodesulfobacteriota bacterium]